MCGVAITCGQHLQPVIDGGLDIEHVERGAGHVAGLDRIGQRGLVDEIAARRVDDADSLLGGSQPPGVDDPSRLLVRRHVQRHVVGAREHIVERHELDAEVGRHLLGDERVVRDDAHAEGGGAPCDLLADAAKPGEAEGLLPDLLAEKLLLLPLALLHRGVRRRQVAGHRQDQSDGELGDGNAVGAGRVHDDDAAGAGGGHVNVVDAGSGAGDDPQRRRGGNQRCGDLGGAADDEGVRIPEVVGELVGCPPGAGVDVPAFGAQQVERRRRKVVSNDDFQW